MNPKPPIHLLLRFSDSLLKEADTIENHKEVIQRAGAVWFGKMGSPISQHYMDILNDQIEKGIPTFVFLVKGNRRESTAYRGTLLFASKLLPTSESHLVPAYYSDLDIPKYVGSWVKLTEIIPFDFSELANMQVASSVLTLGETLVKSSSGHFYIRALRKI